MFNEGGYWDKVRRGELIMVPIHEGVPTPDKEQPLGTRTMTYALRESKDGPDVARIHGFVQPGWVIGASGMWDPKRIFKDGILYRIVKEKDRA